MTHTPGPWTLHVRKRAEHHSGIVIASGGCDIAYCHYSQEAEANARLIAAAPDLLSAAKHLLDVYGAHLPNSFTELVDGGGLALRQAVAQYERDLPKWGGREDAMIDRYVIWSCQPQAWWKPNRHGYTESLKEAGRYSWQEAAEITVGHLPAGENVAMLESEALQRGRPKNCAARSAT